jgi:hypothetical protein
MKRMVWAGIYVCMLLQGCYNNKLRVGAQKLSSNKRLNNAVIHLLVVDSLGADGFPARFCTEKIYEATLTGSRTKLRRVYFSRRVRHYQWKTASGHAFNAKEPINGFVLQPHRWYYYRTGCRFGFLAEGVCVLFFSINERGEVKYKRADEINDGPF